MAKKKAKKKNAGPTKALIRLSQCMITKNEEKNIERALSWGKGIVFEQIVVDTGSTDKTVEIAERMGAKVYHFEWINDFSAAKNFAIEKASGNWIAFLDADEYFNPADAKKLHAILKIIQTDEILRDGCLILKTPIVNLSDEGKPVSVFDQDRVFRNVPQARYVGKIHERVNLPPESLGKLKEITIMHTGYSASAFEDTGKAERNLVMLRKELEQKPDDANLKAYIADALSAFGDSEKHEQADALYLEVVNSGGEVFVHHRLNAYRRLIDRFANSGDPDKLDEAEELCKKGLVEFPENIDLEYLYGMVLNKKGDYEAALEILRKSEEKLINAKSIDESAHLTARPEHIYAQLGTAAQGLGDLESFVKYATMALAASKKEPRILGPFLQMLISREVSNDEIMELLEMVYDLDNPQDLLFIARAAKDYGAIGFAKQVIEMAGVDLREGREEPNE